MRARRSGGTRGHSSGEVTGAPEREETGSSAGLPRPLVGSVALGAVLQPLNSSMIAVALVGIRADFDAGSAVNWLVSALYLATAVAAPAMGRLADMLGARRMFLVGLGLVVAGSVPAPFAPNLGVLVVCRVVLGLGTGAQYPCGVAVLRSASERLRASPQSALGALVVCSQVSVAFGPTLGGLLVGLFGWAGIFWINLPLAALAAVTVLRAVPADPAVRELAARNTAGDGAPAVGRLERLDLPGLLLFAATMTGLMFWLLSLAETPRWWWLVPTALCGVVLVVRERRAREPFLNLELLTDKALRSTYLRTTAIYTAFYMIFYGLPQWLEEDRGYTATNTGLVVLPIALVGAISTVLATRLEKRRGPRSTLLIGTAVLTVGGVLLMLPGTDTPVVLLLGMCVVLGLPNGFNNMGNQTAMYAAAPPEQIGAASGLYRTAQYVGANLAAAALALVLGEDASVAGLHATGVIVACISGVLLVAAFFSGSLRREAPLDRR